MYDATVIRSLLLTFRGAYCLHLQSRFRQITIKHGVISQKTDWYCSRFWGSHCVEHEDCSLGCDAW